MTRHVETKHEQQIRTPKRKRNETEDKQISKTEHASSQLKTAKRKQRKQTTVQNTKITQFLIKTKQQYTNTTSQNEKHNKCESKEVKNNLKNKFDDDTEGDKGDDQGIDKSFKQSSSELKALWAGPTNEYNGTSDSVTCTIDSHTGVVSNEVQWRAGTGQERTKVSWKQGNIVSDAEEVG